MKNAGHYPMLERHEEFNEKLSGFATRVTRNHRRNQRRSERRERA